MRRRRIRLIILLVLVLTIAGAVTAFLSGGYDAEDTAAAIADAPGIRVTQQKDGTILFAAEGAEKGLVVYPGGLVEYTAYAPLCRRIAERGVSVALVRMPMELAFTRVNAAQAIPALLPEVTSWYVGGHSLGGSMAGSFLAGHKDRFDGLVLLAAYAMDDLTDTRVLSIYGTQDGVMNRARYEKYRAKLPADLTELVIEGGCHSYFGDYGMQKGDGTPTITRDDQQTQAADAIAAFILE